MSIKYQDYLASLPQETQREIAAGTAELAEGIRREVELDRLLTILSDAVSAHCEKGGGHRELCLVNASVRLAHRCLLGEEP